VALARGLPCGGWCPAGRRAEDGPLDARYPLMDTPSEEYAQRTEWNVRDSDGTLALARGRLSGGTALTVELAKQIRRPCLIVDLDDGVDPAAVRRWIAERGIRSLNVAGSRESLRPGIYAQALRFLTDLLAQAPGAPEAGRPGAPS